MAKSLRIEFPGALYHITSRGEQRRSPAASLETTSAAHIHRNDAIAAAYQSGEYSYHQIADFLGIHFTTVGGVVRAERAGRAKKAPQS